ncbi:hypothetical protein N9D31_00635 [Oligoflexaceae bacterium]|nr:hypothetical protein [Oligoflexaceae bacterium]
MKLRTLIVLSLLLGSASSAFAIQCDQKSVPFTMVFASGTNTSAGYSRHDAYEETLKLAKKNSLIRINTISKNCKSKVTGIVNKLVTDAEWRVEPVDEKSSCWETEASYWICTVQMSKLTLCCSDYME